MGRIKTQQRAAQRLLRDAQDPLVPHQTIGDVADRGILKPLRAGVGPAHVMAPVQIRGLLEGSVYSHTTEASLPDERSVAWRCPRLLAPG